MIGQTISIAGQQCKITAVGSTAPITTATATVATGESLKPSVYYPAGVGLASSVFPLHTLAETVAGKIIIEVSATGSWLLASTSLNAFSFPFVGDDIVS